MPPRSRHAAQPQASQLTTTSTLEPPTSDGQLAFASTFVTDLGRLLTCSICVRPLYEPYTSACGHTHCYSCLCHWFSNCGSHKTCADCRAPISHPPAPAYLIRELTHKLTSRAEFLPEGETLEHHEELRAEEAVKVEADKSNTDPRTGGLFKGLFRNSARLAPIRDAVDGVDRCPYCHWELEDHACAQCGYNDADDDSEDNDYSGTDMENDDEVSIDSDESMDSLDRHNTHALIERIFDPENIAISAHMPLFSDEEDDSEGSSMADFISDDEPAADHATDAEDDDQSDFSTQLGDFSDGASDNEDASVDLSLATEDAAGDTEADNADVDRNFTCCECSNTRSSATPEQTLAEPIQRWRGTHQQYVISSDSESDGGAGVRGAEADGDSQMEDSEDELPVAPSQRARRNPRAQ